MEESEIIGIAREHIKATNLLDNKQYSECVDKISELCEKICENVSGAVKYDFLLKLSAAHFDLIGSVAEEFFVEGFKRGMNKQRA